MTNESANVIGPAFPKSKLRKFELICYFFFLFFFFFSSHLSNFCFYAFLESQVNDHGVRAILEYIDVSRITEINLSGTFLLLV